MTPSAKEVIAAAIPFPEFDKWHPVGECEDCGYNFIRVHKTLKMSPAMAAGVSKTLWSMEDLCQMMDAAAPKLGPRGPYKKRDASA